MTRPSSTVDSVRKIPFRLYSDNGDLISFAPDNGVPFPIARVFTVAGVAAGSARGNHAHRSCSQLLVCLSGSLQVELLDGVSESRCRLEPDGMGLLIPPLIWNRVNFVAPQSVLLVLCNLTFAQDEYIRDWDEFLRLRSVPAEP